ncbi:hypothetical protein ACFVZZ_31295 [Streptomyces chartreusis]|uniref:hypothetical protein n=1 Tax=Streptomyces chartreusis TaxID=1969 RepID=UPI0036DE82B2
METPLLILLGAAGGSLRGFFDAYSQVMTWRTARLDHRKSSTLDNPEPPLLRDYFDPFPDLMMAFGNAALGAITAGLFVMQGQISGAYAAVAVGLSAPALLSQIGQIPAVNNAVTATSQAAPADPTNPTIGEASPEGARQ